MTTEDERMASDRNPSDIFFTVVSALSLAIALGAIVLAIFHELSLFPRLYLALLSYAILAMTLVLVIYVATDTLRRPTKPSERPKEVRFSSGFPRYVISTLIIEEWFNYLVHHNGPGEGESMCFAYGLVDLDTNTITPCGTLTPKMSERSWTGVVGDPESVHQALSKIDRHLPDHALVLTCHLHPGHGRGAVLPSITDRKTHRDMEKGGYPVIGAIFSQDGYVHFYSVDREFELSITGGGVEKVGERTFHINT